jgi:hypothetical protein
MGRGAGPTPEVGPHSVRDMPRCCYRNADKGLLSLYPLLFLCIYCIRGHVIGKMRLYEYFILY